MKRVALLVVTNLAILLVLSVVARLLGIDRWLVSAGGNFGTLLAFAALFGFGGALISLLLSKWIAKRSMGVRVIGQPATDEEAWLVQTVRMQAQAVGIGMPEVGVFDSAAPNAFATGARRDAALVAVSTGLLQTMRRPEVEGVLAHEAVGQLGKLFTDTPVSTWRSYLTVHYLDAMSGVLPEPFDTEHFDFFGHKLAGQPQQKERWKRAVAAVSSALGEAVGQLYVQQYFPAADKAQVRQLVENLRHAYMERFETVPWMAPATRKIASQKLTTFRPKIAYPDKWRDYSALQVKAGDAFGNRIRAVVFEWQRELKRIDLPTDRDEWEMTPQTINAYYNSTFNEIVFPAAILQAPFFDPHADPAVNYGAIGAVIGHEMGHGFDDQGAKSDAKGVLRTWWSDEDTAAFKRLVDKLAVQYDAFEPLPGLHVNGRLTLGENIGDLSGLTVAHEAYKLSLHGQPAPVIDGLTGDQRFFLAYAQVWRELIRDESLRNQVTTDPHSPAQYRVNGIVRNADAWYAAFNVRPGDKLYLSPEQRVHIW